MGALELRSPSLGRLTSLLLALVLVLTACGSTADDEAPEGSMDVEPEPPVVEEPEPAPEPEPEPEPEAAPYEKTVRGAWVHLFDDALKTRAGIEAVVEELDRADANTIVAQVARRWDAYYHSELLPRTPDPQLEEGLDVLAVLLEAAHARDIEVHAWLALAPTWHHVYDDLPRPQGWLPPAHGMDAPEAQRWVSRTVDGQWSDYLDPGLPEVREYAAATAAEIVQRYPVDGIHLDYVRYASERHGYHPRALARYHEETGTSGTPDPRDRTWSAWRRAQSRALVETVADAVRAVDPDTILSAAVIAWGEGPGGPSTAGFEETRAYRDALQDWPDWARDGLVDVLMPMVYFREADDQQATWFAQWTAYQATINAETRTRIVPGVGGWLNAPAATLDQTVRSMGVGDGAMVYSYQQPTADETRAVFDALAEQRWGFTDPTG